MHYANRHVLGLAVLSSFIVGAVTGGISGFFVPYYLMSSDRAQKTVSPVVSSLVSETNESDAVVRVARQASPAVVSIVISRTVSSTRAAAPFLSPLLDEEMLDVLPELRRVGGGSGFFVSKDGLIVTNRHVIDDERAEYTVVTQDGKRLPAKVMARDSVLDLGVLKVEGADYPALSFGDSDKAVIGQTVVAIGNALAEFRNTVTKGIISGKNRRIVAGGIGMSELIEEAIQTDAAINPGNSGGPLLDLQGNVIGVNTAVSQTGQSLGFAIPSNSVQHAIESIQKTGKISRPWLGVRFVMIDAELAKENRLPVQSGAFVLRGPRVADVAVVPGSPAAKAGIEENDIILEIQGQPLNDERSLMSAVSRFSIGDEVELKILRKGEEKRVKVTLEERTDDRR